MMQNIILFGTGDRAKKIFQFLQEVGADIRFWIDSDPDKWNIRLWYTYSIVLYVQSLAVTHRFNPYLYSLFLSSVYILDAIAHDLIYHKLKPF